MASSRKLTVEFIGDTASLEKSFGKVRAESDKTGGKLQGVNKAAGRTGIALGVGLAGAAKAGFDELAEGQKVSAQTAAVLKSTGGSAKVTQKHIENLAGSISKKTGIDDEAIQAGQNLLLTFTGIRNETGKGNKVFDKATRTIADMSTALGQDTKTSAIQLGKALNDPVKGVTALQKVGVSFTASQKDQIKALVKSGDTMGAQKLILKELNKEFGGSAEAAGKTFPGQLNKLKNSFSEVAAGLIQSLLPAMQTLAGMFATVGSFLQAHPGLAKVLGLALVGLAVAMGVLSAATKVAMIAQSGLNLAFLANPVVLVIAGLVALGAAFVIAYKKVQFFHDAVDAVFGFVKDHWKTILVLITGPIGLAVSQVIKHWDTIKNATVKVWDAVKSTIVGVWRAVSGTTKAVWDGITSSLSAVWGAIKSTAGAVWGGIKKAIVDPITDAVSAIRSALGKDGLQGFLADKWGDIKKVFTGAKDVLRDAITAPFRLAVTAIGKFAGLILKVIDLIPGLNLKKQRADVDAFVKANGLARGGAFARTGGVVNRPMTFMGEEAPRHPEFVIPTNPRYRGRARGLLGQAAGAIGMATGGKFSVADMADLWRNQGGSASIADTMGVIGLVESGGDPNAHNPSGASGLWQILGQLVPGNIFNPAINALNAIAKYAAQGLHAWDASRSKWAPLVGTSDHSASLNPLDLIKKLPGIGDLPDWIKGFGSFAIGKAKSFITDQITSLVTRRSGGGTGTGLGAPFGASGPNGVGTFEGVPMANWVIASLNYGRSHGAFGHPTSGYRPGFDPHTASGRSEHQGTQYPHGAVDFGGYDSGLAQKLSYVRATAGFKWPLLAPIGFHDDGHASGTGHRTGGIFGGTPFLGSYGTGGVLPDDGLYYGHKGETVSPSGGPLVHVDQMVIRHDSDLGRFASRIAFLVDA